MWVKEKEGEVKKYYINKSGERVFECPIHEGAKYYAFENGLAEVWVGHQGAYRRGYINRKGEWIWKPTK